MPTSRQDGSEVGIVGWGIQGSGYQRPGRREVQPGQAQACARLSVGDQVRRDARAPGVERGGDLIQVGASYLKLLLGLGYRFSGSHWTGSHPGPRYCLMSALTWSRSGASLVHRILADIVPRAMSSPILYFMPFSFRAWK